MNDSKVYHMSEDMEDQCITEDTKVRLYLSPVRYEKPKNRKETIIEKIVIDSLAMAYSIFITYITGQWMIRSATKWRGYDAVGGEYILIIVTFIGSFWVMWKLLKSYGGVYEGGQGQK